MPNFKLSVRPSLWRVTFVPNVSLSIRPSYLSQLFLGQPFNSLFVHPCSELFLGQHFDSPFIHSFGELFLGRPFNSPFVHLFWRVTLVLIVNSPSAHPSGELFCAPHLFISLAGYFLCYLTFLHTLVWQVILIVQAIYLSIHLSFWMVIFVPPYISMESNILLSADLRFILTSIVMYWVIVENEENQNS